MLITADEIRIAIQRTKSDQANKVFWEHPCAFSLVDQLGKNWTDWFSLLIDSNRYSPGISDKFSVPKSQLTSRPGVLMSPEDQVFYGIIGLKFLPLISRSIGWSDFGLRFSYRPASTGNKWFKGAFIGWKKFDEHSLAQLDNHKYCLFTDISAYYENIDIKRIARELAAGSLDKSCCGKLTTMLERLSGGRGRGIPQAFSPSNLLGEYFLNPIDQQLKAENFVHYRFVDDMRFFVDSKSEARAASRLLEKLLRNRGLNLQSAKTKLLKRSEAREEISRVQNTLRSISEQLVTEIASETDYISPEELKERFSSDPNLPAPTVLLKAWKQLASGKVAFSKSVFHFLIRRLAATDAKIKLGFILKLLKQRPHETAYIVDYLCERNLLLDDKVSDALSNLLRNRKVPEYQKYLIVRKLQRTEAAIPNCLLDATRHLITQYPSSILLPWIVALLGTKGGTQADIDSIDRIHAYSTDHLMRATCIWALRERPRVSISGLLGRSKGESIWMDGAFQMR